MLELIAGGRSNKRIALELGISEKTVKSHVGHVLEKLGVTDRTQAALLAVSDGLVNIWVRTGPIPVLGPITAGNRDPAAHTVAACHWQSSPEPPAGSAWRWLARSPHAAGRS